MPIVDGRHFSYSIKGRKAAKRYAKRKNKNYSAEAIKMARDIYG